MFEEIPPPRCHDPYQGVEEGILPNRADFTKTWGFSVDFMEEILFQWISGKHPMIHSWLVVSTILKNMSLSKGRMTSHI
jgi:hypothetical protein